MLENKVATPKEIVKLVAVDTPLFTAVFTLVVAEIVIDKTLDKAKELVRLS